MNAELHLLNSTETTQGCPVLHRKQVFWAHFLLKWKYLQLTLLQAKHPLQSKGWKCSVRQGVLRVAEIQPHSSPPVQDIQREMGAGRKCQLTWPFLKKTQLSKKQKYHRLLLTKKSLQTTQWISLNLAHLISTKEVRFCAEHRKKSFLFQILLGRTKSKHYPAEKNRRTNTIHTWAFTPATKQLGYAQLRQPQLEDWGTSKLLL